MGMKEWREIDGFPNLVQIEDLNRDLRETLAKLKGIGESL